MRLVPWLLFFLCAPAMIAANNPMRTSSQCLVVLASDWNAKSGVLRAFERTSSHDDWRSRGPAIPVVLGKQGLAWGRGLFAGNTGPLKIEGDNKAPAGIFRLGPAFGYAPKSGASWIKLTYFPLTKESEGVDDPRSRHYNQLVNRSQVTRVDWQSSEQMLRKDDLYKWGVVVNHNPARTPGAGSCIFLHIWRNSSSPTAGCTAMPERDLVSLLHWLDPGARPVLVQMPAPEYEAARSRLRLPAAR